jgi:hypothetical protein
VDGSHIDGVTIRDIAMDAGHVAVFLHLGARLKTFREGDSPMPAGTLRNIAIRGLRATVEAPGILISGLPGHFIEDVTLEDVDLRLPGGGTSEDAKAVLPEAPAAGNPHVRSEHSRVRRLCAACAPRDRRSKVYYWSATKAEPYQVPRSRSMEWRGRCMFKPPDGRCRSQFGRGDLKPFQPNRKPWQGGRPISPERLESAS